VNVVNSESNRFSSESDNSRCLTVKIKCRVEGGGRTVEFVYILAISSAKSAY
jgi:hypothetical protein